MHNFQDYHGIKGMFHIEMYNDSKAMYLLLGKVMCMYICALLSLHLVTHGDYIYLYIHLCPLRLKYD